MNYKSLQIIDGDIVTDSRGRVVDVVGIDKLEQEMLEAVLNEFENNETLCSNFLSFVGKNNSLIKLQADRELNDIAQRLRQKQESQDIRGDELLNSLENVVIEVENSNLYMSYTIVADSGARRDVNRELENYLEIEHII